MAITLGVQWVGLRSHSQEHVGRSKQSSAIIGDGACIATWAAVIFKVTVVNSNTCTRVREATSCVPWTNG